MNKSSYQLEMEPEGILKVPSWPCFLGIPFLLFMKTCWKKPVEMPALSLRSFCRNPRMAMKTHEIIAMSMIKPLQEWYRFCINPFCTTISGSLFLLVESWKFWQDLPTNIHKTSEVILGFLTKNHVKICQDPLESHRHCIKSTETLVTPVRPCRIQFP